MAEVVERCLDVHEATQAVCGLPVGHGPVHQGFRIVNMDGDSCSIWWTNEHTPGQCPCAGHRQGHELRLHRVVVGLDLRQLADRAMLISDNIEERIAQWIGPRVAPLWPTLTAIRVDHWHVNPITFANDSQPAFVLPMEVCVTLVGVTGPQQAKDTH